MFSKLLSILLQQTGGSENTFQNPSLRLDASALFPLHLDSGAGTQTRPWPLAHVIFPRNFWT